MDEREIREYVQRRAKERRGQMDAELQQFRRDRAIHEGEWARLHTDVPSRLHHYTTISGMVGIVEGGAIWASDIRYMNDSSELSYAMDVVADVIKEVGASIENKVIASFLAGGEAIVGTIDRGIRPFIACFCEEADLLSQWRGYAPGQAGVSLGVNLSGQAVVGQLPPKVQLRRVIYDPEQQRLTVKAVVEAWVRTAEVLLSSQDGSINEPTDLFHYSGIAALQESVAEHLLCFKHPAFSEEREWRLIRLVDLEEEQLLAADLTAEAEIELVRKTHGIPDLPFRTRSSTNAEGLDVRFRQSSLALIPYVELSLVHLMGPFAGRIPLEHVVQGPTPHPDLALESLKAFLSFRGYNLPGFSGQGQGQIPTGVTASSIPLRV